MFYNYDYNPNTVCHPLLRVFNKHHAFILHTVLQSAAKINRLKLLLAYSHLSAKLMQPIENKMRLQVHL